ncbi:Histidinol-phosphate aminotransferase 1 [Gammaproteobacteria bacterium]
MQENLFQNLAAPGVRGLTPYQPGKPIEELEREYGVTNAVKLASNENPLGPSPLALAAARSALTDLARYPDGGGFTLRNALALRFGVERDSITLGNGSNDVLELVARALVAPQDEVIYSKHAFAVYPLVIQAIGARGVVTPARDFGHDLAAMAAAVTPRTRLIFIANPNNPTGTWLTADVLEDFIRGLPSHVIVVIDEAYWEYVIHPDYPNALDWLGRYPNLLVTRTFSKAYGLAGLRVGYAVSHPALADLLNRVRQPFNVNSIALAAATAALDDEDHLSRARTINMEGMAEIIAGVTALGLSYIPSVGNFVAVDVGRAAGPIYEALLHQGVIVRPLANYEMPRHLRVTIGLAAENARFLDALARVLRT